ncbi:MAG: prephenate dehydrogenase/arogenate dehydrogenase family protein [Candidatus Helarchaeota archaeon]
MKIAIIGGTGGMGQIFAQEWRKNAQILLCSRELDKAKRISLQIGKDIEPRTNDDIHDADIVIVSVPTNLMLKTCQDSINIMKKGSLLMDLSSVKTGLVNKLQVPSEIDYISCHPLFGPSGTLKDANIILIPIQTNNWLNKLKKMFNDSGSVVTVTDFETHDKIMSKIQVMFHFSTLCFVEALFRSKIDKKYHTRSYKLAEILLKNLKKNLDVILEIQNYNPYAREARDFFEKIVSELKDLPADEFEKRIRDSFSIINDD